MKIYLVTFQNVTEALAWEEEGVAYGLKGRMIPLPSIISSGCGISWAEPIDNKEMVQAFMEREKLAYQKALEVIL